jgi:hypothetical protein
MAKIDPKVTFLLLTDIDTLFFKKKWEHRPSLYIKLMHTYVFIYYGVQIYILMSHEYIILWFTASLR